MRPAFKTKRPFTAEEHATWREILTVQIPRIERQIHPMFAEGLERLGMTRDRIPDLDEVNQKLYARTGWRGVYVEGLEEGSTFYQLLRDRMFPIGQFIRDRRDLNYTPAPDVVHDLYGHIPFYANREYADFCQKYGEIACRYLNDPALFRQFERFFWFTVEFGLIEMPVGRRIFGAGIVSSIGECEYALSDKPEVLPFDVDRIRNQEFRIDEMQKRIFMLKSTEQLYSALSQLEKNVRS